MMLWGLLLCLFFYSCSSVESDSLEFPLVINEVMARNSEGSGIIAPNGKYEDWFELFNMGEDTLLLSDFFVTDDRENLVKAHLPTRAIAPGEYALLWCGGTANMGTDFVGFRLSTDENSIETLYLVDRSLKIVDSCKLSFHKNGIQKRHSLGRLPDGGKSWSVQAYPSPSRANNG